MSKSKGKIDRDKVLGVVNADIKWADAHYKDRVEEDLIRRYEVYHSSRERYRRMYPKLSEKNEMRTFDLWSAVEWMLPNMLKAFFGSDRIISISGVGAEDADKAEQVMKLIQWQLTVKNPGYRVFKSWFGDALVTNLGVLKCYWKRETEQIPHKELLDEAALVGVLQNPQNRIISSEPVNNIMSALGMAPQMAEVAWEETQTTINQPIIEVVKPSDIRFTPDGRTLSECSMVAHRKVTTIDQLRRDAMRGMYDPDAVQAIADSALDDIEPTDLEKILNDSAEDTERGSPETARARVVIYECYLKTDLDDDGLLEDAIVTVCNNKLLRAVRNPYKRAPFFELVPFWDSYQVWGRVGLAEVMQDTQDSHTALLRQMLVSLGLSNQWRAVVDQTTVNLEDFISDAMFIRATGAPQNAFMPVTHPGINAQNFQFFEYLKSQMEEWTPITRYNQGLDGKSLNKTATGVSMIMNAAQQRQEEIIRNFAETGIRELFRFLVQLNQRYLDEETVIRLQNETIELSPDDLGGDFDLSIDASAGVAAREGKVQALTIYMQQMLPYAVQMGIAGPEQFVMAGQKLLRLMGIEDAEKFLRLPEPDPMAMLQQQMMGGAGVVDGGQAGEGAALPPSLVGGQGAADFGGAGVIPAG